MQNGAPRPHPWEWAYPPGLDWGAPIETGTLGDLLARSAALYGNRIAIRYRDTAIAYANGESIPPVIINPDQIYTPDNAGKLIDSAY